MPRTIHLAVEDALSEAVLRRLVSAANNSLVVGTVFPIRRSWIPNSGPSGFGYIRKNFPAFNAAAAVVPHVLLVDLDNNVCAPSMVKTWAAGIALNPDLLLRVAVREVESWIIGDREGLAEALHLGRHYFPEDPERIRDPKRYIVRHAIRSRLKEIRSDVAPAIDSNGQTGPYYTRFLSSFVRSWWDIDTASSRCSSLRRARMAISKL